MRRVLQKQTGLKKEPEKFTERSEEDPGGAADDTPKECACSGT